MKPCISCFSLVFSHTYPLEVTILWIDHSSYLSSNHSSSKFAMASPSTSLPVASSSSTHRWKYDVFLSFRGEDTRKGFTGHLHKALCQRGIDTFIDDQLRRGEQISPALLQAIEKSRFSIIIFSEDYASSSWCLVELTKILECVKLRGHKAFPVFYNVDPSDVRKQTGSYAEAFAKHEEVYKDNLEKVVKWREALTVASELSGWDSRDRHECEVIEEIVSKISNEPINASSSNMKDLVGMASRVQDIVSLLCIGRSDDVRMVGLWGMGGIGKTTIAEAVYQKICTQFQRCCFLSNVREKSQQKNYPTNVQTELLSQISRDPNTKIFDIGANFMKNKLHSMKVLIVLDDVDRLQQLDDLAGNRNWFGPGSRIIITTRDKRVLDLKNAEIYEVKELNKAEALKLFHQYAFGHKPPTEDFVQLRVRALNYTKGVPLALKILGRHLCNRSKMQWESALEKLGSSPDKEIQRVLKISFDELECNEKNIFLDIACFFKGQGKDYVIEILRSCDFSPEIGISILIEKSLITISDNKLCMHDLIQEMGWGIVRQESIDPGKPHIPGKPGKCSRLWVNEDVIHVLTDNTGTEAVEGIVLDLSALEELHFSVDVFTKMNRLRVLRFCDTGRCASWEYLSLEELRGNTDYAGKWRNYDWYKNDQYPKCKLHLKGDFKLLSNNLRYLRWDGYPLKSLPSNFHPGKLVELNMCFSRLEQLWKGNKSFQKLKSIDLSHSQHLIKTPDFSGAPKLRRIILEGCTSLVKVHPSIGALKELISLNLEGCKNLKSFSSSIHMESLQILTFSGCSKLKKFPEVQGAMDNLSELSLKGTAIKGLPLSIEYLNGLTLLNLGECKSLESLPSCIFKLKSLKTLILSNCLRLTKLPEIRENMESLSQGCKGGESKSRNLALPWLSSPTQGLRLPSLSIPYSLSELNLSGCNLLEGALPSDLSSLSLLECLDLSRSSIITVPASLSRLPRLRRLILEHCKSLQSLPELPSSIEEVLANDCISLETFSNPSSALRKGRNLNFQFSNCFRLVENEQSGTVEAILLGIRLAASRRSPAFCGGYDYDAVVPGSSIPEWFNHQSSYVNFLGIIAHLHPHRYNNKCIGLAVCAVLRVKIDIDKFGRSEDFSVNESCVFSLDNTASVYFLKDDVVLSPTDHIWFAYRRLSRNRINCRCIDYLNATISSSDGGDAVTVKKCGFRLVYEDDVMGNASFLSAPCGREKEMSQIQNQETIKYYDTAASNFCTHCVSEDEPTRNWRKDSHRSRSPSFKVNSREFNLRLFLMETGKRKVGGKMEGNQKVMEYASDDEGCTGYPISDPEDESDVPEYENLEYASDDEGCMGYPISDPEYESDEPEDESDDEGCTGYPISDPEYESDDPEDESDDEGCTGYPISDPEDKSDDEGCTDYLISDPNGEGDCTACLKMSSNIVQPLQQPSGEESEKQGKAYSDDSTVDALKKDWQLSNTLIGKEAGLGWDPMKQTINASNEWRDKKLKDNIIEGQDDSSCNPSFDTISHSFEATTLPSMEKKNEGRRKMKIDETKSEVVAMQLDSICSAVENRSSITSRADKLGCSIAEVMKIIRGIPEVKNDRELYMKATDIMIVKENREMFVALEDPPDQIAWLKHKHV